MGKPSGINQSVFPIPLPVVLPFLWELGGLFSLFTLRHKLLPLYPDGKPIVYTGQELRTKLLRLCQPTEAATLRGYPRGHIPLGRPGVVRGPDG